MLYYSLIYTTASLAGITAEKAHEKGPTTVPHARTSHAARFLGPVLLPLELCFAVFIILLSCKSTHAVVLAIGGNDRRVHARDAEGAIKNDQLNEVIPHLLRVSIFLTD